jgi:hypothetical protein
MSGIGGNWSQSNCYDQHSKVKPRHSVANGHAGTDVMIFCKNIFAETFGKNIGVVCSNYCYLVFSKM